MTSSLFIIVYTFTSISVKGESDNMISQSVKRHAVEQKGGKAVIDKPHKLLNCAIDLNCSCTA